MSSRLNPRITYTITSADTTTTQFSFSFKVYKADDVKVILSDGTTPAGYTVDISTNMDGGKVTLRTPLALGMRITIYRDMPYTRQTLFRQNQDFRASVMNEEFDRMVLLLQQVAQFRQDAIHAPLFDDNRTMTLPMASLRANKVLGFDSSGNIQVRQDISESISQAKNYAIQAQNASIASDRNKRIIVQTLQTVDFTKYATKSSLGTASAKNVNFFVPTTDIGDGANAIPKADADFKTKSKRAVGNSVIKKSDGTFADLDNNSILLGGGYTYYAGSLYWYFVYTSGDKYHRS